MARLSRTVEIAAPSAAVFAHLDDIRHVGEHAGVRDHAGGGGGAMNASAWMALLGFLAIAAFFLLSDHRAHVFGVVPYLLLLACPALHVTPTSSSSPGSPGSTSSPARWGCSAES